MQFNNATSHPYLASKTASYEGFFATMPTPAEGPALGSFLTYHINIDEEGEFYADVRDAYGKTVFEIDGTVEKPGVMAHERDLDGLKGYLVRLGVMKTSQDLVMG
ncbi:hypothetical protein PZT57_28615 [Pseudomonas aeruginosa]|uniref:hypothetical protein n=1 Tax=Pseudomonas aeruginosa TaxID=287 RepID=UPI002B27A6F1|nr:hypothetical protein [Pseudomonas aeruginosa]MEA8592616.1 hypothetical protein [Pseudomonas aeruginosa]